MEKKSIDERFGDLSDKVTYGLGKWEASLIFCFFVILWAGFGPQSHYSDSWQLWINTPTTIIGTLATLLTLASANRVQNYMMELHKEMMDLIRDIKRDEDEELALIRNKV